VINLLITPPKDFSEGRVLVQPSRLTQFGREPRRLWLSWL